MSGKLSGRVLALDLGSRRIGMAVSDETRTIAAPLGTFERKTGGIREMLDAVRKTVEEMGVTQIVVGLPVKLDGEWGTQARHAASMADLIRERLGVPVDLQDERLTSFEADQAMMDAGLRAPDRKARVDAVAASFILRAYLDAAEANR
jgi:putative Holliday junction resolvase